MTNHQEAIDCLEAINGRDARLDDLNLRAAHVYALLAIADAIRDSSQTPAFDGSQAPGIPFGGTCLGSNQ